jgi:AsmA protein
MKRALLIGLAAVLLIVVLVVALPFLIPLSAYRGEIEAQATRATGRTVKIDGPLRISLFPVIGLRADNASVASVPNGAHKNLAQTESVQVAVALAPLLSGHIEVSEILLVHPQIYLDVDKTGVSNWSLGNSGASASRSSFIRFVHVKVEDGSVHYYSALSGSENSLAHFNVDLNMPDSGKLAAEGSFAEKDKTISFEATIGKFDALSNGAQSPAHIFLKSEVLKAEFDGMISREGDADGDLSVDTPSLRTVADTFGHPLASSGGFGSFMLRSHFHAHEKVYALTSTILTLDAIEARGQLSLDMHDKLPMLTGNLSASRLDLNPYLGSVGNAGGQDSGWSRKPISLSILADANADLSLSANALTVRNLKIANADLAVKVENSKLSATLDRMGLYGGEGQATLMVDASTLEPAFENHLTFVNMQMAPFLGDTIGVNRIQGTGNIRLDVVAHGHSASDVMHALSGKGAVAVRNGQIRGVDLGMIARTVQTIVSGGAKSDSATTGFSTFGGAFGLRNGVASCNDLALSGPVLTMTGHGSLGIGDRTIDFHLVPKAGIGSKASSAIGLAVPIHVTGTWDHLNYGPDLAGVVDSVIGNIENGGNAIKGLFGGTGGNNNGKPQSGKKSQSVGDSVKSLFGIH